ncbi:VCBS repeat-containing protein [Croceivirga sp. JEA036]|uniref:VCBS repeat-containing protein n=1 Tax=Croceivirga sp. JEA036 TaxID=2721162 RepID=UPI001439DE30|nr:VCBS repeat-containing protein [Croceivirga sp. JEA036]NJB37174.1 VCBS repeat-containing protein [Croceivirga sp. JEA036]
MVLCFFSCKENKTDAPLKLFTLLPPVDTGINFMNELKETNKHNILKYANFYGGAGVGLGDFNNDGLLDVFFAGNIVPDKLYLNQGNLKFTDASKEANILQDLGWSTGVTVADVNADGYLDIYVSRELYDDDTKARTNLLYINNGDATFKEQAKKWGVANNQRTRHATFLDYNKDGALDLFLLTQPPNPGSLSSYSGSSLLTEEHQLKLYKNTGDGFVDVTQKTGLAFTGFPNAVSASDINNDGYTDIFVANDFEAPDFVFLNNQDGTFSSVGNKVLPQMSFYSMGVDVADMDNDKNLDVFVLDMVAEDNFRQKSNMSGMDIASFWNVVDNGGHYQYMYNALHKNNGNGTFSNVANFSGMQATDWSWSNLIADFDNDGLKDVYITNGLLRDIRNTDADKKVSEYINQQRFKWLQKHPEGGNLEDIFQIIHLDTILNMIPSQPLKNYAFKNKGDFSFDKVAADWGLDHKSFSNGAAYGDLDNDGDLDMVVNNINATAFVYRNNSSEQNKANYLRVIVQDDTHKTTLGSRVYAHYGGATQLIELTNVRGIYSTSEQTAHFGIGTMSKIDSVEVFFPDGKRLVQKEVPANTVWVANASLATTYQPKKKHPKRLFKEEMQHVIKHTENTFDDFQKQLLLPHKMSQFGPAMAVADINNDGLDDIFLGGASGFKPQLLLQEIDGSLRPTQISFWNKEAPYEDVDAVFIDVNNDGFLDLYVASGGNAYPENDFHYTDRLYMNIEGKFKKGALLGVTRESGGKIAVADYDNDGDVDVFVTGRHTPYAYPTAASSTLYVNIEGQLQNKTLTLAPDLENLGMATAAQWADVDGDEDLDLMVVGEWMPITVFVNTKGQLKKISPPGLSASRGWWFGLTSGDFDGDGDPDFIAGNLGLNYKYKTSKDAPFDVYYDDFDRNGKKDIVLGYHNGNTHFPLRGFSCSSQQIPSLKKEIKKYDIFAAMDIEQIYGAANLNNALHLQADTFASVYIENLGNGDFKMHPLPNKAQLTNWNNFLVRDFNADGNLDVLGVGNLWVAEIETPKNDAGIGILLLGDGKGNFTAQEYQESGFYAAKDAKQITLMQKGYKSTIVVANNNDALQFFTWINTN